MKKIYTIFTIALCAVFGMQAQFSPIAGEFKTIERKQGVKKVESVISKNISTKAVAPKAFTASQLAGTYTAYAPSAFQGEPDQQWAVTIEADATDANKIWIQPVLSMVEAGLPDEYINPVYATINADGTLSLPMGQILFEQTGSTLALAASPDGTTKDLTSSFTLSVSASGKEISFDPNYIFGIGDIFTNTWWYQAVYEIVYVKDAEDPIVNVYEKGNSTPVEVKTSNLFFNEVDGEMCVTSKETYSSDKIAGTYAAYAPSAFQGKPDQQWVVKIVRDETDPAKVWLHPIMSMAELGLPDEAINPVYATYDEAKGTLKLPMGQLLYAQSGDYSYNFILACTLDGRTVDVESTMLVSIVDGNLVFDADYIIGIYNTVGAEEDLGWWQAVYGVQFTRNEGVAIPLSNIEKISRK